MRHIVIDLDEGWFDATVRTADGDTQIRLDALHTNNMYSVICREHEGDEERGDAWVAWLMNNGVPKLTHAAAYRLAAAVIEFVRAFGEKDLAQPAAPAGAGQEGA